MRQAFHIAGYVIGILIVLAIAGFGLWAISHGYYTPYGPGLWAP